MAKIDVKFMKADRKTAQSLGNTYKPNKKKTAKKATSKKKK